MDANTSTLDEPGFQSAEQQSGFSAIMKSALSALRRRWLMLAFIILLIFGATVIAVTMMTPKYSAMTRIKIDPSQSAALGQLNEQNGSPDQAIVDTEVSVMRSLDIARAVVKKEHLVGDREFSAGLPDVRAPGPGAPDAQVEEVARAVLLAMTAQRERATYIVELSIASSDPAKAARIANTFAEQYIAASLDRRSGTAERQADFLTGQLKALSDKAADADSRLAQYRAGAGVVTTGVGSATSTVTDQQIAPLAGQLATAPMPTTSATSRPIPSSKAFFGSLGLSGGVARSMIWACDSELRAAWSEVWARSASRLYAACAASASR